MGRAAARGHEAAAGRDAVLVRCTDIAGTVPFSGAEFVFTLPRQALDSHLKRREVCFRRTKNVVQDVSRLYPHSSGA